MSDLVKRLRNEAPDDGYGLCCEAADEIERLREAMVELEQTIESMENTAWDKSE